MTREESQLVEIVARIIDIRRAETRINPSWIATEAMKELDPRPDKPKPPKPENVWVQVNTRSVELVYLGCHLQLRQIARAQCRKLFEDDDEERPQKELFTSLQWRYPTAHSKDQPEREYILRDRMSDADISYNVSRLRLEAEAKQAHADALEAWGRSRRSTA